MSRKEGYITVTSVLIISAIALVISVGLLFRSVDEARILISASKSYKALSLANSCASRALFNLKSVLHYAGNEVIMMGDGECTIRPVSGSGNTDRIVELVGDVDGHIRRIRIEVSQVSPTTTIAHWQETSEF